MALDPAAHRIEGVFPLHHKLAVAMRLRLFAEAETNRENTRQRIVCAIIVDALTQIDQPAALRIDR